MLEVLRKSQLYAKQSKCEFGKKEVEYLGFIVEEKGIGPVDKKTRVIKQWPTPMSVKTVHSFLGLAGYYARFIEGYATLTAPLSDLLVQNQKFIWGEKQEKAFQLLKEKLTSAPVLKHSDLELPFIIYTDASDQELGAALHQIDKHGKEHPVYYKSKKLQPA